MSTEMPTQSKATYIWNVRGQAHVHAYRNLTPRGYSKANILLQVSGSTSREAYVGFNRNVTSTYLLVIQRGSRYRMFNVDNGGKPGGA